MPHAQEPIALVLLAALAGAAAADTPAEAPLGFGRGTPVAHIYFNLATGEKVATLLDGAARPVDVGESTEVWVADNLLPCAGFGQVSSDFGIMEDPYCTTCFDSATPPVIFLDWGDISFDQIVDCVGIAWAAATLDSDTDGDGIGDGVPGFGAIWSWYDADNGFDSSATRQGIMSLALYDLPGTLGNNPREPALYYATVDLGSSFASCSVFEIGDTDSDSPTPNFKPLGGMDLDSDGGADFSYSLTYRLPGTFDWDNDGVLDGSILNSGMTGWPLAAGDGSVIQNPDGSFSYQPETSPPGALGIEDVFDIFVDKDSDGDFDPWGSFWYGGINCSPDPAVFNPYAQFYSVLYGPTPPVDGCWLDVAPPFGVINFFDIIELIARYNMQDPYMDIALPFGVFNIFDIQEMIARFNNGCP